MRKLSTRRYFLCGGPLFSTLLFGAMLCSSVAAQAAAWDIDQLMAALGGHREGRATFVETTYLKILQRPLESSGELSFAAPDRLQKLTLKPRREVLTLSGGELSIERKGRTHTLQMSDYPEVAAFIDSIRDTLMGNRAALERGYQLSLSGDAAQWSLLLAPTSAAAKLISRITIAGNGGSVTSVEIVQADGDRSLLRIDNIAPPAAANEAAP